MNKTPSPIDKHVAGRVRLQRILVGMSQEKLGEALGITFQQVQKYEKGTNRIGAGRLQRIAETLNVPLSFFYEGAPKDEAAVQGFAEEGATAYVSEFVTSTEGLQLNMAFARILDARVRKRIIALVEVLADNPPQAVEASRGDSEPK